MATDSASGQGRATWANLLGPILVFGFGAAVALWTVWFITHVPWIALSDEVRTAVLLAIWLAAMVWAGSVAGLKVAVGAGLTTSILGLLLIGTRLAPGPDDSASPERPSVALIVLGFLALGVALGALGG